MKHSTNTIYPILFQITQNLKKKNTQNFLQNTLPLSPIEYKCMANHWFQGLLNGDLTYQMFMFSKTPPVC